jgi:phosphohistidine phosphatase
MDLYIIRHGQAGHFGDPRWPDDAQRPLTEEGKDRFAQVVEKLVPRGVIPDIIATSPLLRCVQTAQILAEGLPTDPQIATLEELAPGGDLDALLEWTVSQTQRHRQVAWVGHAPGVGRMTAALFGSPQGSIRFAKGAIASIRFHGRPEIGHGELRWLVTAKMLGC